MRWLLLIVGFLYLLFPLNSLGLVYIEKNKDKKIEQNSKEKSEEQKTILEQDKKREIIIKNKDGKQIKVKLR